MLLLYSKNSKNKLTIFYYLQHKIKLLFSRERKFYLFLQKHVYVKPLNIFLYKAALSHKSSPVQDKNGVAVNNERLEFLGDAILDSIIGEYLYRKFPNEQEGFLSKIRSKIVSRDTLNQVACDVKLNHLVTSLTSHNKSKKNLYGNAFEAFVGAVYLDRGYNYTYKWITKRILHRHINMRTILLTESDFKSRLIEWCQKNRNTIVFETFEATSVKTKKSLFVAAIYINKIRKIEGVGLSKKEAEQDASKNLYPEVFPQKQI